MIFADTRLPTPHCHPQRPDPKPATRHLETPLCAESRHKAFRADFSELGATGACSSKADVTSHLLYRPQPPTWCPAPRRCVVLASYSFIRQSDWTEVPQGSSPNISASSFVSEAQLEGLQNTKVETGENKVMCIKELATAWQSSGRGTRQFLHHLCLSLSLFLSVSTIRRGNKTPYVLVPCLRVTAETWKGLRQETLFSECL